MTEMSKIETTISKGALLYAWARDQNILERGESGGAVVALLKFALESGTVDAVLAVKRGYDIYDPRPTLITDPDEVEETSGSMHCGTLLLSKFFEKYLDGAKEMKVAAVLKGCDVMGLYEQAKRGLVELENVFMIGLNCGGSITSSMARRIVSEKFGLKDPGSVTRETIEKGRFFIEHDGIEEGISIPKLEDEGYGRRSNCKRCKMKIPRQVDLACGNWGVIPKMAGKATFVEVCSEKGANLINKATVAGSIETRRPGPKCADSRRKREALIQDLSEEWRRKDFEPLMSAKERLRLVIEETSRCIKCYTCIEVCPVLFGSKDPYLTADLGKVPPGLEFHLARYAHVADSCVNCGQCEELCPLDIPNTLIMHSIATELEELYGYHAGEDLLIPAISRTEETFARKKRM